MKPFAKLYLTRLKTYEKECAKEDSTDATTTEKDDCPTTDFSDFSECSVKCGKGTRHQLREFLDPEDEERCKELKPLRVEEPCDMGKCLLPADDPKCELTEWSDWSSCTASCGKGVKTHDKKFKTPEFSEECENNDPSVMQENEECSGEDENCEDFLPEVNDSFQIANSCVFPAYQHFRNKKFIFDFDDMEKCNSKLRSIFN